ncbi:MAG: hypothetical protein BWX68_02971 [Verrucomicrobia bacterium ADurb.Bin063]|nr:MAG: hypothetical protein BWX68_02971 [Verrucomicrobia bacterium ADurb.Bin063]
MRDIQTGRRRRVVTARHHLLQHLLHPVLRMAVPKHLAVLAHHEHVGHAPLPDGPHIAERGLSPVIRRDGMLDHLPVVGHKLPDLLHRLIAHANYQHSLAFEPGLQRVQIRKALLVGEAGGSENLNHIQICAGLHFHWRTLNPFLDHQRRSRFPDLPAPDHRRQPGHQRQKPDCILLHHARPTCAELAPEASFNLSPAANLLSQEQNPTAPAQTSPPT